MAKLFEKISKDMKDRGYNRDPQQCRVKLKELRQAYQKARESNGHSGSDPQTCCFYDELHAILGGAPTTTPPLYMDSCKGVSRNRDEDLGDQEGEVEDSTQQASGETVLPNNQELFITLGTIPSQPRLPDLEGGEGTSAANVSTLLLSSPSQRLAQIKRQKNSTRNEMFSELMQFSRTERAQQNAWRQTISEYRKAENEREDRRDERDKRWQEQDERWRQHNERRQEAMLRLLEDQTDMLRCMVEVQERQQEHRPPLQPLCN
ncbi:uncharacterized protein LOC141995947 [Natator depressus]|uniref:uncharacterized protein LOC141995947 n=1 Tax=Natator depressus TaxID=27790 RepID=UPI003EBCB040